MNDDLYSSAEARDARDRELSWRLVHDMEVWEWIALALAIAFALKALGLLE